MHSLYDVKPPTLNPVSTSMADNYSPSLTVEDKFHMGRKIRILSELTASVQPCR